jgi:hypothetical protein
MPQFTPQPAQKQKIIFKKKKKLWRFFSSKDLPHGTAVYAAKNPTICILLINKTKHTKHCRKFV